VEDPRNPYLPLREYTGVFFSKQAERTIRDLKYGRENDDLIWQKDMDLIFWFEL